MYVPANDIRIYTDRGIHQEITLYVHIYVYIYYLFAQLVMAILYSGTSLLRTLWDFSIQSSPNTLQYYTGGQNGVLITEVSTFQRFGIERPHCTCLLSVFNMCYHIL